MKFFAPSVQPTNNWDMSSGGSWWPFMGSIATSSGVRVGKETAMSISAVSAATRVISETLASLPLNTLEQEDARTQRKAYDHPLWTILHDAPNPEMDIVTYLDMQSAFQTGWGNAFSEIQRNMMGEIVALWPIHPSRIPNSNIRRNPSSGPDVFRIYAGQPGELVFWVNNDDGTASPIPSSDMFLVPGVLSRNGITGQSLLEMGARALGIAIATEDQAGSFFKHGAVANMILKSTKSVDKPTADRLRESWSKVFGGANNAYKTIILEDGMDAMPINVNPEQSQLLASRAFSITEVARLFRLPPHKIGDLSRSSFSNIEAENLSFVIDTMLPWIRRWEAAMQRQLLTREEKKRYRFKFNVNGLLRGDSAARAQFYQIMFNLGAMSPNDIRGREDENPIPGGDQYFVQGNNAVPLDKIGQMVQSQIDKNTAPPPAPAQSLDDRNAQNHERLLELRHLQEKMILSVEMRDATLEQIADTTEALRLAQERELRATVEHQSRVETTVGQVLEVASEMLENGQKQAEMVAETLKSHETEVKSGLESAVERLPEIATTIAINVAAPIAEQVDALAKQQADTVASIETTTQAAQSALVASEQRAGEMDAFRDSLPTLLSGTVESLAKQAAEARDTSESDEIAAKQAVLDAKQAEFEAKQALERTATHEMLALSLKREIDKLAEWESRELAKAATKPLEWMSWRAAYYGRFRKYFVANMEEYIKIAAQCGIVLDLQWGADRYADASIVDLKTLDEWATDNFHDRLKECADMFRKSQWSERPKSLAAEMVERGKRLFSEQQA